MTDHRTMDLDRDEQPRSGEAGGGRPRRWIVPVLSLAAALALVASAVLGLVVSDLHSDMKALKKSNGYFSLSLQMKRDAISELQSQSADLDREIDQLRSQVNCLRRGFGYNSLSC